MEVPGHDQDGKVLQSPVGLRGTKEGRDLGVLITRHESSTEDQYLTGNCIVYKNEVTVKLRGIQD